MSLVPTSSRTRVSDRLYSRRIYEFVTYDNPTGVWFPLQRLPHDAEWRPLTDDNKKYMQLSTADGRRILFLVVGAIHGDTILIRPNELSPRLRIQLELLRETDRAAAADIFNSGNSHGKVAASGMTVLSASTRADTCVGVPVSRTFSTTAIPSDPHNSLTKECTMQRRVTPRKR